MPRDPLRKTSQARRLRTEATPAETILWKHLRGRRFDDFKFRRQKPIGPYIVDFVCAGCQVIVELDGETHLGKKDYDEKRDTFLKALGYLPFHKRQKDSYPNQFRSSLARVYQE